MEAERYCVQNDPRLDPTLSQLTQSTPEHSSSLLSVSIYIHLRQGLPRGLFYWGFSIIRWREQVVKLLVV